MSSSSSSDWIEKFDPKTSRPYYVNRKTRKTQWKRPADFEGGAARVGQTTSSTKDTPSKILVCRTDGKGKTYYIDPVTKKSMWKATPGSTIMTMEEFDLFRQRRKAAASSSSRDDSSAATTTPTQKDRVSRLRSLFSFSDEKDWPVVQDDYDFNVHHELIAEFASSTYKMTFTIESTNGFGGRSDLILDIKWNESDVHTDWRQIGHLYVRGTKSDEVKKAFLLAEISYVDLDKHDATRCAIQFRPPHFLTHMEQFKFEEQEPYPLSFKNAADRSRFMQALKYARLKALELMEIMKEKQAAQLRLENATNMARSNLATWPVAMVIGTSKVLQLKLYWKHGTEGACMMVFKDTTSTRNTRLSMYSKDIRSLEFGSFETFGLTFDVRRAQFRDVVPLKMYHSSKHVKRSDHFIFLFDGMSDVMDFTYHAMTNLGHTLIIRNPSFYASFDPSKAKHSKYVTDQSTSMNSPSSSSMKGGIAGTGTGIVTGSTRGFKF